MQSNNLRDYSSDRNVRSVEQQIRSAISGDGNSMLLGYDWQRLDSNNFQIQLMLQKHYRPYLAAVSHNLARRHSYSFVKGYLWWLLSSSFSHFDVSEFDFGRPSEPEDVWLNQKQYLKMLLQNIVNDSGEKEDDEGLDANRDALEVYLDKEREHKERVEKILSALPDDETKQDFIDVSKDAQGNRWSAFMSAYLEISSAENVDTAKKQVREIFGDTNVQD